MAIEILNFADGKTSLDETQVDAIENKLSSLNEEISDLKSQIKAKDEKIAELEKQPGEVTSSVVEDGPKTDPDEVSDFFTRMEETKKLNSLI